MGWNIGLLTCSTRLNHKVEDVFFANYQHASKMARAVISPRVSCTSADNPDLSSELSYARICHESSDLT